MKLHSDIQTGGWHSSLLTTYSVDPVFYDSYVERFLRQQGCENNILLADAAMLTRALHENPEGFRRAGQRYAVVPIAVAGCFHPKIHLRLGRDKARLIVGSANATSAGWCRNLEVLAEFDWHLGERGSVTGPLIRKAYDYCSHWLQKKSNSVIDYKVRHHWQGSPWLADFEANTEAITLADGTAVDIFCERGGEAPSLVQQFRTRIAGERVRQLIVVSPYWDADLSGLRELCRALPGCRAVVVLHPEHGTFPVGALKKSDDFTFVALQSGADAERFPHCKVILAETAKADHVLYGSANCSDDALGLITRAARNAEVSVYRRTKPGVIRKELQLDISFKLTRSQIRPVTPTAADAAKHEASFQVGHMELVEESLLWFPDPDIDAKNSRVLVGDLDLPCNARGDGSWAASLTAKRDSLGYPLIARVRLATGVTSAPVIVHEESALRSSAPGHVEKRLQAELNRMMAGEADMIDLVPHIHQIFAPDVSTPPGPSMRRKPGEKTERVPTAVQYSTPAEFRRALTLRPGSGRSGRFSFDDPGLSQILRIVMRSITSFGPSQATGETIEQEEDFDLLEGDTEDGAPEDADEERQTKGLADVQAQKKPTQSKSYTIQEIESRRSKILKSMRVFDEKLEELSEKRAQISCRLAGHSVFMIRLMMWACTYDHKLEDGNHARLIFKHLRHHKERDSSFAFWVAKILRTLWVGKRGQSLAQHIVIDRHHASLPDDIVAWIVMSRWAITRADLAAREMTGLTANQINQIAACVFAATEELGPVDSAAEELQMRELDRDFGCSTEETDILLGHARSLSSQAVEIRLKKSVRLNS